MQELPRSPSLSVPCSSVPKPEVAVLLPRSSSYDWFSWFCSRKAPAEETWRTWKFCPCLCCVLGSLRTKSTGGMAGIIVTMVTNLIRAGSSGVDFKWQHGILCESIALLPLFPPRLHHAAPSKPTPPRGMRPSNFPTCRPLHPPPPPRPTHSRGLENATVEQFNNTAARCATVYPTCHSKDPFSGAETCYPAILTNTSWGPGGVDGCIQFPFLQLWSLLEGASRLNNSPAVAFKTEPLQTNRA